jgi:hypothetical protein
MPRPQPATANFFLNRPPSLAGAREAAYETTLLAGELNARRGASKKVLLTQLGGGAFGNDDEWIYAAMRRALKAVSNFGLDVKLVSYGQPSRMLLDLAQEFG